MKTFLSFLLLLLVSRSVLAQGQYYREEPVLPGGQATLPWMQHPTQPLSDADSSWYDGFGQAPLNGPVFCISERLPIINTSGAPAYAVAGAFTRVGSMPVSHVAIFDQWDRTLAAASPDSIEGTVYSIAASKDYLYVGGHFTTKGGARNLARLELNHFGDWEPVGTGTDSTVLALAVYHDSILYVGGNFTKAGPITAHYIARYNSKSDEWHQIVTDGGEGADGGVTALLSLERTRQGEGVAIGGAFRHIGNRAVNCVATLSDTGCVVMGNGIDDPNGVVECLAEFMYTAMLYAGGHFTSTDGSPTWDVAGWSDYEKKWQPNAYLQDTHGTVYALSDGFSLTIGGDFVKDGADSSYLRVISPYADPYHALSHPPDGPVYALRDMSINWMEGGSQSIYIGGDFHTIAGHYSPYLADYEFFEDVSIDQQRQPRINIAWRDAHTVVLHSALSEPLDLEWIDITGRTVTHDRYAPNASGVLASTPTLRGLYLLEVRSTNGIETFKISVP